MKIKNKKLRIFLMAIALGLIISFPSAPASECSRLFKNSFPSIIAKPEISSFIENIYAVHATQMFPKDGIIIAGNTDRGDHAEKLIHFAIGNLVPAHDAGSWDAMPVAILTPLKDIMPKAGNFFAQDTIILGNYSLPRDAVVMVQKGTAIPAGPYPFKIVFFEESLESAIAHETQLQKKNLLPMRKNSGWPGDPAYLNGYDINSKEFYEEMKSRYPQIEEGNAMESVFHKTDYGLQRAADIVLNGHNGEEILISNDERDIFIRSIERRAGLLEAKLNNFPSSSPERQSIEERIQTIKKIMERIKSKPTTEDHSKFHLNIEIAWLNSDLTLPDFFKLLSHEGQKSARAKGPLILKYIVSRLTRTDVGDQEVKDLLSYFDQTLKGLSGDQRKEIMKSLDFVVSQYVDVEIHNPVITNRFEALMQLDSYQEHAQKFYTMPLKSKSFFELSLPFRKKRALQEFFSFFSPTHHQIRGPDSSLDQIWIVKKLILQAQYVSREIGLQRTLTEFLPSMRDDLLKTAEQLGKAALENNPEYSHLISGVLDRFKKSLNHITQNQKIIRHVDENKNEIVELQLTSALGNPLRLKFISPGRMELITSSGEVKTDPSRILGSVFAF